MYEYRGQMSVVGLVEIDEIVDFRFKIVRRSEAGGQR